MARVRFPPSGLLNNICEYSSEIAAITGKDAPEAETVHVLFQLYQLGSSLNRLDLLHCAPQPEPRCLTTVN